MKTLKTIAMAAAFVLIGSGCKQVPVPTQGTDTGTAPATTQEAPDLGSSTERVRPIDGKNEVGDDAMMDGDKMEKDDGAMMEDGDKMEKDDGAMMDDGDKMESDKMEGEKMNDGSSVMEGEKMEDSSELTEAENIEGNDETHTEFPESAMDASATDATAMAAHVITFDGKSYSPSNLTINEGDTVTWKNNGSGNFWPASNVHPTHQILPEFDARQSLGPGTEYSFKFNEAGSWKWHDHLRASKGGTITVQ